MEQASFTVSSWQEQPIDNLNENFPVNQALLINCQGPYLGQLLWNT